MQSATVISIGRMPFAPGTFGSAAGFLFVLLLRPRGFLLLAIAAAISLWGVYAAGKAEDVLGRDAKPIVIDEFAGYLISVLFLPLHIGWLIAGFVLFRLFDILKPPPVSSFERLKGGLGVMMDDIAAGIISNLILQAWRLIWA